MAFSVPDSIKLLMTGIVSEVWSNTPGVTGLVTIYKESIQNVVSAPQNPLYGYGENSSNQEIVFETQSQNFAGQILYPNKPRGANNYYFDNKLKLDPNSTYLRARQDVFDYINNGVKTEKIEADGKTWNYKDKTQIQNFLGLTFYFFELEATN